MKFICVKNVPEKLDKNEHVIEFPSFLDEVKANSKKCSTDKITKSAHLRHILGDIGMKYADGNFSPYTDIRIHKYEGIPFNSDEELSRIIVNLLDNEYPKMFEYYISHEIQKRPKSTELIYFTGDFMYSAAFTNAGFQQIQEKDIETTVGRKEKKVIGKPAIKTM